MSVDMGNGIVFEPAECAKDCSVPDCHFSHGDTWFVCGIPYFTHAAAEAALRGTAVEALKLKDE